MLNLGTLLIQVSDMTTFLIHCSIIYPSTERTTHFNYGNYLLYCHYNKDFLFIFDSFFIKFPDGNCDFV